VRDDQLRAFLIVGALLSGTSGTGGFVGGRMSVSTPPAEVRLIRMPPRVLRVLPAEAVPVEPTTAPPEAPAPPAPVAPAPPITEPPVSAPPAAATSATPAPVEVKPTPPPRPKVEAKPKAQPKAQPKPPPKPEKDAAAKKLRPPAPTNKALPSCAVIQREYDAMNYSQRMSSYFSATPEEIAHGRRCLGL